MAKRNEPPRSAASMGLPGVKNANRSSDLPKYASDSNKKQGGLNGKDRAGIVYKDKIGNTHSTQGGETYDQQAPHMLKYANYQGTKYDSKDGEGSGLARHKLAGEMDASHSDVEPAQADKRITMPEMVSSWANQGRQAKQQQKDGFLGVKSQLLDPTQYAHSILNPKKSGKFYKYNKDDG